MNKLKAIPAAAPVHYVVWESIPGGMESYIPYYNNRFNSEREVYVYSLRPAGNLLNISPGDHFKQGSASNWQCYLMYFRYCRANRKNLFHIMNSGPFVLFVTLMAGVRHIVYHIHGTKHWKAGWGKIPLKLAWAIVRFFPVHYIANSKHSGRVFHEEVMPVEPQVIYNGFELTRFTEKRWLRAKFRRMAYIGRFDRGKNAHLVIRLFEEIAGSMPELELHLAGSGDLNRAIEEQVRMSPFADRITLYGWVKDPAAFCQAADLFVFLSDHESFGNVIAEALLTGLPVLTSDVPVFKEIYGDEKIFNLGNPHDYPTLLSNFRKAIEDYPALAQKAFEASERLSSLFDMETHLKKIERFYETV
ncbi:MAG: glycosyltransferase [Saprospirales bacterium]|nr:glycosyltransferase [Saprospirales bacterium]MBK6905439.1 glycosyltransferase [Saprospirales bacterium]MBK7334854.1 glycosyltransferase [Saprospirales bacterium]